jgi:hypothetical protein
MPGGIPEEFWSFSALVLLEALLFFSSTIPLDFFRGLILAMTFKFSTRYF